MENICFYTNKTSHGITLFYEGFTVMSWNHDSNHLLSEQNTYS